jgi:hypothetical protein
MAVGSFFIDIHDIAVALECICKSLTELVELLTPPPIVGIAVISDEEVCMKKMLLTKSAARTPRKAAIGTVVTSFNLVDNGNGSFTVVGVDAAGNQVDISAIATLTAVSDTPTVITVSVTSGSMTFQVAAATPAPAVGSTANITLTATWNDASIGPFSTVIQGTIQAGNVVGIAVVS